MLMKSQYIFNADKAMLELLYKTITVYLRKIQFQLVKKKKRKEKYNSFSLKCENEVSLVLVKIKLIFLHQV